MTTKKGERKKSQLVHLKMRQNGGVRWKFGDFFWRSSFSGSIAKISGGVRLEHVSSIRTCFEGSCVANTIPKHPNFSKGFVLKTFEVTWIQWPFQFPMPSRKNRIAIYVLQPLTLNLWIKITKEFTICFTKGHMWHIKFQSKPFLVRVEPSWFVNIQQTTGNTSDIFIKPCFLQDFVFTINTTSSWSLLHSRNKMSLNVWGSLVKWFLRFMHAGY